ncbi:MAG: hypothetical protein E6X17_02810 [Sporomusaceae bacterium]|nr:hypothetical protein [Sporomusaceae bacterium]
MNGGKVVVKVGAALAKTQGAMNLNRRKPTVIFDFDGVVNSYRSGWTGVASTPDPPVAGIGEAIAAIRRRYRVVIVSSRCYQPGGIAAIRAWLDKYGITVDDVTGEKPPAKVIVDDRAITFDGNAAALLARIDRFQPWTKAKTPASGDSRRQAAKQAQDVRPVT